MPADNAVRALKCAQNQSSVQKCSRDSIISALLISPDTDGAFFLYFPDNEVSTIPLLRAHKRLAGDLLMSVA